MKNKILHRMLIIVLFAISLIYFQDLGFAQSQPLIDSDTLLDVAESYKNILNNAPQKINISLQASNRKITSKKLTVEASNLDDVYTFYDLHGIPSAYVYTTLNENNEAGYIAISATRELHPLLSSSSNSHPMSNFDKCMKTACSIDSSICENSNEYTSVYLGMFYYFFVFNPNSGNPVVVEAMTESIVPYDILISMQEKYDLSKKITASAAAKSWEKTESIIRQQSSSTTQTTSTISNVPKYNWYRGCTTTSATMILSYYGVKGFEKLAEKPDSFPWTRPKNWMFDWLIGACDSSSSQIIIPKDLADEIADKMAIPEDCGFFSTDWGANANEQAQVMKIVASNHGYSFNATVINASNISTYMSEIDANRPVAIHYDIKAHENRSGKHSAAGYGYTKVSDTEHILYVDNTWFTASNGIDSFTYENAYKAGYIINFISFIPSKPLAATLQINGGTSSTKSQGGTFNCTGSNYTHNRSVTRYLKQPNGTTITLSPTLYADSSGNINWSYTSICSTPTGKYSLWVKDDATGKMSNSVTEIVNTSSSCSGPQYEGWVDSADCSTIRGWAWDKNNPNTPISIDIYNGSTKLTTISAGAYRKDLVAAGKGNGYHGFSYATPSSLKDGSSHSIYVKYSGTSTNLSGSPKTLTCTGYASVSQGVKISANPVKLGQNFTISFTLKEVRGASKTFEDIAIAILDPKGNYIFDFKKFGPITVSANGTKKLSAENYIYSTRPAGTYKAVIRGKVGGQWFDFDTTGSGVTPKSFSVVK